MSDTFQNIIIGVGQGGQSLAVALAEAGQTTAIVERQYVGGTCVNYGCIPSKAMIAAAEVAQYTRRAAEFGVHYDGEVRVDLARVNDLKQSLVEAGREGGRERLQGTDNLELIYGEATFVGPKALSVTFKDGGTRQISGERIFVNVGLSPLIPPIDGLDSVDYLNSTTVMELRTLPEHLIVVGGGYIGLEFAQAYRRYGSRVTVVETNAQLSVADDDDVAEEIEKFLKEEEIELVFNARAKAVSHQDNTLTLTVVDDKDQEHTLTGTHLLLATGRRPNTEALNPKGAGIEMDDKGFIKVDEHLRTNVAGVYALGDVKGGPAFTHISYDDQRVLVDNLLAGGSRVTSNRPVPFTMFTDPQYAHVGLSETQASKEGKKFKVAKLPMSSVPRASALRQTFGFMKAIVDADTDRLLGATVLGIEGGETLATLQVAMEAGFTYQELRDMPLAHPTVAESLNNLFAKVE